MQSIRQVARLNDAELEKCVPPNASWHTDYRDTAYIYIGGLPFELSEGDILTVFSQYGNPVHINLVRDKDTGKSRGFCFLKYEDQRSCDLAVDNLSGAGVMGRVLSVDHTRYKKKEGEVEGLGELEEPEDVDEGRRKRRRTESPSEESEEERPMIKEEIELAKLMKDMDDDDPMKAYLVKEKKEEVADALKAIVKQKPKERDGKHSHRHHRSRREGSEDEDDRDRRRRKHRSRREPDVFDSEDRTRQAHRSRREPDESDSEERTRQAPRSRREDSADADDRRAERAGRRSKGKTHSPEPRSQSREPYRRR